ncbi:aminotransferase class V-fold PLP-dependent enzyme [Mesobacillus zeae]|uniref:Aminotransferase class V-fold PLP-dependent enzyme n=1 Tax=Mesobacillus zeae TaxID=1917180 RepID=A0A398BDU6_9BACI|nr:aminotransferase class V-fold PLP-dependent enzyme [Mesobacillus zeae]RID87511.1 aminotransferase class V-fold PLP-dependent enzyme [Mesobacillus zeae]
MYWCKIARTPQEFDEIAQLNYATFVEEIPQHEPNETKRKVDRFHDGNTYLLVYKNTKMVAMLTFRDQRPFSLDEKIGAVETHLPQEVCVKLCEMRLLAVKKEYRTGRVFLRLTQAVYNFAYDQGYTAVVISGTTREQKLYTQMGFVQFAEAVGTADAQFLPMVLTRERFQKHLEERLVTNSTTFYPGPVRQLQPLEQTGLSHRSGTFQRLLRTMNEKLLELSHANYVSALVGSGTLANDVMLGQLKERSERGLILSNGEFGGRLIAQAEQWTLDFEAMQFDWGQAFDLDSIQAKLKTGKFGWLLFVHGETSTGTYNDLETLGEMAKQYQVKLCADCISTFGALPYSMEELYLATSTSGKAIGAVSGLAFVFSQELAKPARIPAYLNLQHYQAIGIPFTIPATLVDNVAKALRNYPERYAQLQLRYEMLQTTEVMKRFALKTRGYPMIVTLIMPKGLCHFSDDLKLNGLYVHCESNYLLEHDFMQLSIIQPGFEEAIGELEKIFSYYMQVHIGDGV